MRASAEGMVYGRSDGIRKRVEGLTRSMSGDREGRQRMIHGGRHPGRWGGDGRDGLVFG
jgi:hypothetical protein